MRYLRDLNSQEQAKFIATFKTAKFVFARQQPTHDGLYWHRDYIYHAFQNPRNILRWPLEHLQWFSDAICRDLVQRNAIELHQVPVFNYIEDYNLTSVGNMAYVLLNYNNAEVAKKALLWLESLEKYIADRK